jgi:hypothetical protein
MAHGKDVVCMFVTPSPACPVSYFSFACFVGNTRQTLFAVHPDRRRTTKIVYHEIICCVAFAVHFREKRTAKALSCVS